MSATGYPLASTARRRSRRATLLFFGMLIAFAAMLTLIPAHSASADETGEEYDNAFVGNVKYNSEPLADVRIEVSGNGYTAEVVTDADGKWKIGVPEKDKYTVTLDETTLPEGVAVTEGGATIEAEFGLTGTKAVNFFIGRGERHIVSIGDQLVERIVNGINFGLMLALASIGASLVFGTTGLSNFAHGEMVTFGGVMALVFGVFLKFPFFLAIPIAVILGGVLGLALDAGIWRPLRRRGMGLTQLLIVSIGLSLALRYVIQYFIGGNIYQLPGSSDLKIPLFGSVALTVTDMVSMAVSILVILAVAFFLTRTRIGKATRAVSDNASLAAASGIDVDRVVRIVWIISGALAALSGVLWAYFIPGVKWDLGAQILLLVFASITLGGLGTAFGALVGSLIVGFLVEVSTLVIPSDLKYLPALLVLIIVLLFRPQGILGRRARIG